jgi:hypothetical protein
MPQYTHTHTHTHKTTQKKTKKKKQNREKHTYRESKRETETQTQKERGKQKKKGRREPSSKRPREATREWEKDLNLLVPTSYKPRSLVFPLPVPSSSLTRSSDLTRHAPASPARWEKKKKKTTTLLLLFKPRVSPAHVLSCCSKAQALSEKELEKMKKKNNRWFSLLLLLLFCNCWSEASPS